MEKEIAFFLTTNMSSDISSLIVWDSLKAYFWGQIISCIVHVRRKSYKERSDQIKETDKQYARTKGSIVH